MKHWIWLMIMGGVLSGCATQQTSSKSEDSLISISQSREVVGLEGLEPQELAILDKNAYFLSSQAKIYQTKYKKNAAVIFINSNLKQKNINLNTVNLRHWIHKNLDQKNYFVDRLGPLTAVAILVEYGMSEVEDATYKQFSSKTLYSKYLRIYAIDYIKFKNKKKIDLLWDTTITSLGPSSDLAANLPILAAFLPENLEKDFKTTKKLIVPVNDSRLESTREIPTSIPMEDFKPTIDELNFFN